MEQKIEEILVEGKFLKVEMVDKKSFIIKYFKNEVEKENHELPKKEIDEFVLVDAESLSLDDEFMKYEPTERGYIRLTKRVRKAISYAIKNKVKNFYIPKNDPSLNKNGDGICFASGKTPAIRKSYFWWEKAAKDYAPERGSRLGTKDEYFAFLGVLIKKLMENGMSAKDAWNVVCKDSTELGHYKNSRNARDWFESTGSRNFFGFCDLGNTYKILQSMGDSCGYCYVGGAFNINGYEYPICTFHISTRYDLPIQYSVGWVILEK